MLSQMEPLQPINPTNGEKLPPVPVSNVSQIKEVVRVAKQCQISWGQQSAEDRGRQLGRIVRTLTDTEVGEQLARLITQEMGKPIRVARAEIASAMARIPGFIDQATRACASERTGDQNSDVLLRWRPRGVVGVIAPWNYPVSTPMSLIVSALLTGNSVVLKPSELTPRTGARLHQCLAELLPDGVVGLVQGRGDVGSALVSSDIDMVAFTGSIRTGQAIMRASAEKMHALVLEMGGKDPMIVMPGADIAAAGRFAVSNSLLNSGQVCVSVETIYAHESILDSLVEKIQSELALVVIGDPNDESTTLGPMVSAVQREQVMAQLDDCAKKGANMMIRGQAKTPGFYLEPSLVLGVREDMDLVNEETFGPVIAVATYSDEGSLVERVNRSRYGLGASIWGPEGPELETLADRLECGMIGMNRGLAATGDAPWVGWKMSGFGYSRGIHGMRQFMRPTIRSKTRATGGLK